VRRRFNWLVLAVASLLVVAFVVPLALLVRRQAEERAQVAAEQRAQSAASVLAVAVATSPGGLDREVAETALVTDVAIVLPGGAIVGNAPAPSGVVNGATSGVPTADDGSDGSWSIGVPVSTADGVAVVVATAPSVELSAGVLRATLLLALLALVLIAGSVALADRLGRSLVRPVTRLADVAGRLAGGELDARADPADGPEEVRSVARAMNDLAGRLDDIISGEREALADLSHRLRTPLTSLRLQAEAVPDPAAQERLLAQVDRTQRAVDQLIQDVRNRGEEAKSDATDLAGVAAKRVAFWRVLADDQGREVALVIPDGAVLVPVPETEIAAALDVIIGNVFAHTPAGVPFSVEVALDGTTPLLTVADAGPGFGEHLPLGRGESGAGSTGLGLDIARALGARLGGGLDAGEGPAGGALVTIRLGP
jgi:signal transduction histidine kinase